MKTKNITLSLIFISFFGYYSFGQWGSSTSTTSEINRTGRVGIGTSNANNSSQLHVSGTDNDGSKATLRIQSGSQVLLMDGNEIDANSSLFINKNTNENVLFSGSGRVGIGTESPEADLHVEGSHANLVLSSDDDPNRDYAATIELREVNDHGGFLRYDGKNNMLRFGSIVGGSFTTRMVVTRGDGNVGIGTTSPNFKLDVKGKIRAEEIRVQANWSDFVFEDGYYLRPLSEVASFIDENGHLPEIPSAKEIEENGVPVGEVESKLLMKIEELTLYLIEQNQKIAELQKAMESK